MLYRKFIVLFLLIVLTGCVSNNIRTNYKTGDLNPAAVNALPNSINYLYKLDPAQAVDYMVIMVRMNVLNSSTTKNLGEILLSFYPLGKEVNFACETFYSKLTESEKDLVNTKMETHPFICKNPNYSKDDALRSFPHALSENINLHNMADSHWAWYGATGDTAVLKRFLDNYLYNPSACNDCIKWSFYSSAEQNPDVKEYLINYMANKSEEEQKRLRTLLPD